MAETSHIPSSSYNPNKFIEREEEELSQIYSLLTQSQPRIRAVVISGERGVGKTWLSLHLQRSVFKEKIRGVTSWLFSLLDPGEGYRPEGDIPQANEFFLHGGMSLTLEGFLKIIIKSIGIELPPDATVVEQVDSIRRYVQSHADHRFVLILDSAFEGDWSFLKELETHFLGTLLTLGNFFVIVTGRGNPYPWKVPYLIEAITFGLGSFSEERIKSQIEKFGLSSSLTTDEIYAIGAGWPVFTEHLARARDRADALGIAANILFAVLPAYERLTIRRYFEALCPLDGFGETEAELMVKTYEQINAADGRTICRRMNETRLASWKNGRYEINVPVLNILRQYLFAQDKDAWVRLQTAAYQHFQSQAADAAMQRFRPNFEKLMQTHARALTDAGIKDL